MKWAALLDSGQRDGGELRAGWAALQLEAWECAEYLGEEVEGVLAVDVVGAGSVRESLSRRGRGRRASDRPSPRGGTG